MKRTMFCSLLVAALLSAGTAVKAVLVNATGQWQLQATNGSELITGVLTLNQVGSTIIGSIHSTTINGTMVSDTKMDAKFNGPRGAGWLTVYFTADGKSFQGQWGYNGKKPGGKFIGQRVSSTIPGPTATPYNGLF
jgi:hypothetical protein